MPLWVQFADHPWLMVWLPAKLNCRLQPLSAVAPVFAIVTLAVKPAPQSFCTAYVTLQADVPEGEDVGDGDADGETDGEVPVDGDGEGEAGTETDGDGLGPGEEAPGRVPHS